MDKGVVNKESPIYKLNKKERLVLKEMFVQEGRGVIYPRRLHTVSGGSVDGLIKQIKIKYSEEIDISIKKAGFEDPPYVEIN